MPLPFEPDRRGNAWVFEAGGREVRLSNLDKIYYPEDGFSKGDVLSAYHSLAAFILPHLRDRPLTLVRMPDGIQGNSFYEKQAPAHTPDWVPRAHIVGHGRRGATDFLLAQDTASLLFVVNLGCIEMHPMHGRAGTFDRPDYAFFDLDPFPPADFSLVRKTALLINRVLSSLGLTAFPKTSGATGMQVMVPLDGSHDYEEARAFVERVCRIVHRAWPEGTTMEHEISKRAGKVFLDYAMVSEGRNIAGVYSLRAQPGAPVSTPLTWEEVDSDVAPGDFTVRTIWDRLERTGDLFAPVLAGGTPEGFNLAAAMDELGVEVRRRMVPADRGAPSEAEPLATYKRKRRFDVTPEPAGAVAPPAEQAMFMIHKHHARRLHFDLRLERGGVLVSFAVPKGLPVQAGQRRLAVHVEDHPLEYATFEGTIPEGEYGAGEVRIFDAGTYEPREWTDKKITIRLRGERISGEYHLVQTDGKNWLAMRSSREPPLALPPAPPVLQPMLATSGGEPFDGDDWIFEIKWDGARTLALVHDGVLRLISRRGRDVTAQYPEMEVIADRLAAWNAAVDGEIVCLDEGGRPSFERLQGRISQAKPTARQAAAAPVDFLAFDLLWLDGESLVTRPLEERRELLERSLAPGARLQVSPQFPGRGIALFGSARERGLEGVIAKKRGSIYVSGKRSHDWIKIKAVNRVDCVIVGWTPGRGTRGASIGALVVALYRDRELSFCGHVGTGFTEKTLRALKELLAPLATDHAPVEVPPRDVADLREVRWVRPELVCEVEYLEFTGKGILRAPSYKGLREDKAPEDCVEDV